MLKGKRRVSARASAAVALAAALCVTLAGCAAMRRDEARHKENLLVAAGFRMKSADTPAKVANLKSMPANKIVARTSQSGQVMYTYADPLVCNCIYVGTPSEYAEYRRLALQKQISEEQLSAAMANESAAMDWEMWGPWGMW